MRRVLPVLERVYFEIDKTCLQDDSKPMRSVRESSGHDSDAITQTQSQCTERAEWLALAFSRSVAARLFFFFIFLYAHAFLATPCLTNSTIEQV